MTERVTVGNLRVAQVLYDFVNDEALPGTDIDPDRFWSGVDKVVADLAPKNQDLLARRDDLQAQIDKWHRARVIGRIDPDELQAVPHRHRLPAARARRLHHHHRERGRRDHHHRRPAAGGADPQRPLRAQRRQRPLGLALRRAVRHRRHPRGRRRREGHAATTRSAATRSSPTPASSSTSAAPLASGSWADIDRPQDRSTTAAGQLVDDSGDGSSTGLADARAVRRLPRRPGTPTGRCCWSTTACTSRS